MEGCRDGGMRRQSEEEMEEWSSCEAPFHEM